MGKGPPNPENQLEGKQNLQLPLKQRVSLGIPYLERQDSVLVKVWQEHQPLRMMDEAKAL